MSTPMSVDSEEEVTSASGSMPTPMMVDSEMMKDPVEPQARSVHDMIVAIRDVLPRVTSNMNQCERIADRFKTVGDEAMKSMELQEDSKLFKILRRGQILVQGYADTTNITAREISNGDNRDEFREFHEELHYAWAERGFPSLPKVEESVLQSDAENDKMAIEVKMEQRKSQSSSDEATKKQAQVVLDKTKNMDEFGPGNMPSYLAIDSKSSDVVIHHVPVKPKKSDEFVSELPVYLSIDRNIPVGIDNVRAGRPEWKPKSLQDPVEEVGWVIVHPGKWLGCDFAIKVFKCNAAHKFNWNERELKKEVQSLVALQHPHVVRFVGFGQDEERCLFLMELMDGDLKKFMAENVGRFDKLDVINQIAKGMYYMHERDYVHGDLKCTNILVKKLDDRVLQVKIGDLRGSQNLKNWNRDAFDNASKIRRPRWTAPEVIDKYGGVEKPTDEQLKQLKQSDVYSFGMTCYEIVTGKLPYQNIFAKNGLLDYIREGRVEEFNKLPDDLDEDLKGMIRRCWRKEPSERPTSAEICQLLKTASSSNRVCAPMLSFGRSLNQLLKLWSSNTSSVNSGSHGTYPHVNSDSHGTYPHVAMIPQERLERSSTVKGSGVAGEVFKATWLNCTVAVKKLKNYPKSPPNAQQFPYEVQYLIEVSHHPCTVQLIGLSEYAVEKYEIVMEYVKMNLRELVDIKKKAGGAKGGPFKFEKALLIITKLALGMVYLHSRGLVHRDLKPQNVLVVDYSENVDVKIADFGESHLEMIAGSTYGYFDGVGSRFYRAPEVFRFVTGVTGDERLKEAAKRIVLKSERGKLLNEAARRIIENLRDEADLDAMKATDVYSFGMVCYMVLTGEDPYCDLRSSDYEEVWNGIATLRWTSDTHLDLKLLVERCVQLNPTERPTFEQICQELHKISLKSN